MQNVPTCYAPHRRVKSWNAYPRIHTNLHQWRQSVPTQFSQSRQPIHKFKGVDPTTVMCPSQSRTRILCVLPSMHLQSKFILYFSKNFSFKKLTEPIMGKAQNLV